MDRITSKWLRQERPVIRDEDSVVMCWVLYGSYGVLCGLNLEDGDTESENARSVIQDFVFLCLKKVSS